MLVIRHSSHRYSQVKRELELYKQYAASSCPITSRLLVLAQRINFSLHSSFQICLTDSQIKNKDVRHKASFPSKACKVWSFTMIGQRQLIIFEHSLNCLTKLSSKLSAERYVLLFEADIV